MYESTLGFEITTIWVSKSISMMWMMMMVDVLVALIEAMAWWHPSTDSPFGSLLTVRCSAYVLWLGLIRLQRIYNFWLFHAIILSVLDVNGLYFTLLYYFGTNLLTGGPAQIDVFCLFQCFAEKEYQTESKQNKTFGSMIFGTNVIQRTWSGRQEMDGETTRQGVRPPPSCAPRGSTDLLLPAIYTHMPWKHRGAPWNPISTDATFCTKEIPSWGRALITEGLYINSMAPPMMCE